MRSGPCQSHENFIIQLQEAHSLSFPRVAPNSYQHTVFTGIHLAQSSPTLGRSFLERVQEYIIGLTNCSRQLHHARFPRPHGNCFSFHAAFSTTIVDPHDSTAIPTTVLTEATPPSGPFSFKAFPSRSPSNITKSVFIIDNSPRIVPLYHGGSPNTASLTWS